MNQTKLAKRVTPCLVIWALLVVILLLADVFAVRLCRYASTVFQSLAGDSTKLIITTYVCSVFAWLCMYCLLRLLLNLRRGEVFIRQNVTFLGVTAAWCFCVAAVCAACAAWYCLALGILAVAACFMGMIVLIVRAVFRMAMDMKAELDLTI